ncbi:MAG: hypothetical protein JXQ30_08695 [Spirochaetes bacterium]|nr:hypothetical protein [Spirochaetota bacterium]
MLEDPKTKLLYDTDGVQTVFPINIPFDEEEEIHAWIRNKTTKLQDKLVNPDDFFLEGKNLITTVVWADGYLLVIKRIVSIRQLLDLFYGGPLPSEAIEKALDYLTKIALQHEEKFSRSLLLPETIDIENLELQDPEEGFYLRYLSGALTWVQAFSGNQTLQPFMKVFLESLTAAIARSNIGAAGSIPELSDTEISGPENLDLIQRSGDKWKDRSLTEIFGAKADGNPWRHDRYGDAEAISAMGEKADENPLNHDRYTDAEAVEATAGEYLPIINSGCRVYRTANQSIPSATPTRIQLNNEDWDINSEFDSTTNYRFTAKQAGYYQVNADIVLSPFAALCHGIIYIYKNGESVAEVINVHHSGYYLGLTISDVVYLDGNSDYIELYAYQDCGSSQNVLGAKRYCFMSIHRLS